MCQTFCYDAMTWLMERFDDGMGLLPGMSKCGLCMRRECRERFPRHRGLAISTCITVHACHDPCRDRWLVFSFEVGSRENAPGIPGACATRNFTIFIWWKAHGSPRYILLGDWPHYHDMLVTAFWSFCSITQFILKFYDQSIFFIIVAMGGTKLWLLLLMMCSN